MVRVELLSRLSADVFDFMTPNCTWGKSWSQLMSFFLFSVMYPYPQSPAERMFNVIRLSIYWKCSRFDWKRRNLFRDVTWCEMLYQCLLTISSWYSIVGRFVSPDFPTAKPRIRTLVETALSIGKIRRCKIAWMFVMERSKLKACRENVTSDDVGHKRFGKKCRPAPPVLITMPFWETIKKLQANSYHDIPTATFSSSVGHRNVSSQRKISMEYCVPQRQERTAWKFCSWIANDHVLL